MVAENVEEPVQSIIQETKSAVGGSFTGSPLSAVVLALADPYVPDNITESCATIVRQLAEDGDRRAIAVEPHMLMGAVGAQKFDSAENDVRHYVAESWTASVPAAGAQLLMQPRLYWSPGLLSPLECAYLMTTAELKLSPARVRRRSTRELHLNAARVADEYAPEAGDDAALDMLSRRIASVVGLPGDHAEGLSIVRYRVGGRFDPHYDAATDVSENTGHPVDQRGPRLVSFIGYLNDGYQGGETAFPLTDHKIAGHAGDGVYFWNHDSEGQVERKSLHASLPVKSGEKWVCLQWFRRDPIFRKG